MSQDFNAFILLAIVVTGQFEVAGVLLFVLLSMDIV
jgi:hypothetical protein